MKVLRHGLLVVSILAVPLVAPRASDAQGSDSPSLASLFTYDSVRTELGLTEDQLSNVQRILETREDRPEARREAEEKLSEVLQPKQQARLAEIRSQVLVSKGVLPESLRAELQLAEEQMERLAKAESANAAGFRKLLESLKRVRFRSEKAQLDYIESKYRKPAVERLKAVLTPEQRKSFERLQGETFPAAALIATSS